jgi:hypothetical protein
MYMWMNHLGMLPEELQPIDRLQETLSLSRFDQQHRGLHLFQKHQQELMKWRSMSLNWSQIRLCQRTGYEQPTMSVQEQQQEESNSSHSIQQEE